MKDTKLWSLNYVEFFLTRAEKKQRKPYWTPLTNYQPPIKSQITNLNIEKSKLKIWQQIAWEAIVKRR